MSVSPELGQQREVKLPQGTLRYRERGSGEPLVFVHGAWVNGDLWREVVARLGDEFRCIAPDWPFGAHEVALAPDADLSAYGVGRLIADFLEALRLDGATLVASDTGGAYTQIAATRHPERIGRLVLTNCDAFDNWPPRTTRIMTRVIARAPHLIAGWPLIGRRWWWGRLFSRRVAPKEVRRSYSPWLSAAGRRDVGKVAAGIEKRYTLEAAERLRDLDMPALVAWAPEDWFFPTEHGERLAAAIPGARLEWIPDSLIFPSQDQPERTARLISEFVRETPLRPAVRSS